MVANWASNNVYVLASHDAFTVLELLFVFAVACLLWFLLRWRNRSRCSAAQPIKDKVALTNQETKTKKTTRSCPLRITTKIQPDEGPSAAGCFGYAVDYLSKMLGNIGLPYEKKNPDYIRGLSVYSLSAVSNIGRLATGAYAYPSVEGWEERTKDNVLVRSLSWNWVNESAPDLVKIVLTKVDMKRQRSCPTLEFSISWSTKFSENFTKATHDNPRTFYISKRTSSVMRQDVTHLRAKITYKTAFSKTGTIEFTPKPLKDIDPKKTDIWTSKDGSVTLYVNLSTLKFSEHCPDPSKESMSSDCKCKPRWDTCVPVFHTIDWDNALCLAILGRLNFESCVYIDNQKSSTQCWIFRLVHSKTVAIAFRGTQTDRIYDFSVDAARDVDVWQQVYDFNPHDPCILHLNPDINKLRLRVHRGFFRGYLSVRDIVLETVYQMTEGWNSEWSIAVTGHSLGASLAILCGTELANRTLKDGVRPNVSSLLLAPVRTGHKKFVEFYNKSIPYSYRVVNQVDYVGSRFLRYFYDHVLYEIHCVDPHEWVYTLPDSSCTEQEVKCIIVKKIEKSFKKLIGTAGEELAEVPAELEDHMPHKYLFTVWHILKHMREPQVSSSAQIEDVPQEEP